MPLCAPVLSLGPHGAFAPLAVQDANSAIALDQDCELAYFRKGLACFELDEFETAVVAFGRGRELLQVVNLGLGEEMVP